MKIAIHHEPAVSVTNGYKYCIENQVPYKLVNCYDSDIMAQLDNCQGLMWHWKSECITNQFYL